MEKEKFKYTIPELRAFRNTVYSYCVSDGSTADTSNVCHDGGTPNQCNTGSGAILKTSACADGNIALGGITPCQPTGFGPQSITACAGDGISP